MAGIGIQRAIGRALAGKATRVAAKWPTGSKIYGQTTWLNTYWINRANEDVAAVYTGGFNPGQETIWTQDILPEIDNQIATGEDFTREGFILAIEIVVDNNHGSGTYDRAFSDTIESLADQLLHHWDSAYGGDGYERKLFFGKYYD